MVSAAYERKEKQSMNAVAFNSTAPARPNHALSASEAPADRQPFSAYLSDQIDGNSTDTAGENTGSGMTLNEAAGMNSRNAVNVSGVAEDGTIPYNTPRAAADSAETTLGGAANSANETNNALMLLLLLMGVHPSGDSGGMNAAMMSLMTSMQGEGINGLLGATGLSGLASVFSGRMANATGQAIVGKAMTRLGDPYSKSKRGTGNYVDCSYLAQWAYKQAGIDIPGTAARQAQYCYENGYEISKEELQPGDLIFWTKHSSNAGRWRNIHHVAIYAGNGKIVEAKNPQNGVEVADMWGEGSGGDWEAVMYARPY